MLKLNKYQSAHEAVEDHKKNYRSQGFAKGKFHEDGPDRIRINRIIDHIQNETTVLDIGCNDGAFGLLLQNKYCTVYGVDVVAELVDLAVERGVLARVGQAEKLEFPNESFEYVNMAETMEHLFEPEDAVKEIHRVLKKDGTFLGSVPHPKGRLGEKHDTGGDYHQHIFNHDDLKGLFGKYFDDVQLMDTPWHKPYCDKYNLTQEQAQWINWVCKNKKS